MNKKEKIGLGIFVWFTFAAFTAADPATFLHRVACAAAMIGFVIFFMGGDL